MKLLYFLIFYSSFLSAHSSSLFDLIEEKQDEKFIEAIFKGADLNETDKDGNTYLHKAILEQNQNLTMFLANHRKISINALNHQGQSPALIATLMSDLFSLEILSKKGANLYLTFNNKSLFSFVTNPVIAEFLMKKKLHLKIKTDSLGRTYFHQILEEGNASVVQAFLEKYPFLARETDKDKKTPLHYLFKIESLVDRFEIADLLLKHGADVNAIDIHDKTPLFYNLDSESLSKKFIEHGADIHYRDFNKENVLFETVRIGNLSLLEYFLKKGVDLKQRNWNEETLLMHAKDERMIRFLLKKIDYRLRDRYGNNLVHHLLKDHLLETEYKIELFYLMQTQVKRDIFLQKNRQKQIPTDLMSDLDLRIINQKQNQFKSLIKAKRTYGRIRLKK